jgi:hypothetical protein
MAVQNYVKKNISYYVPAFIEIIGKRDFSWRDVEKMFNKHYGKRIEKIKETGAESIWVQANIYDIIIAVKKADKSAIRLLDYFNKFMLHLSRLLNDEEKKLITASIWNILTAFDSRYLDFMGEMAVLNGIMATNKYQLNNIEFKLPNGKTIDFRLKSKDNGTFTLVEVYNIHLNSERVIFDKIEIEKFLTGRLIPKINAKTEGLTEPVDFDLAPVIWGTAKDLKVYSDYFKSNSMHIPNVNEPFAYSTFIDTGNDKQFYNRFRRISRLFDDHLNDLVY